MSDSPSPKKLVHRGNILLVFLGLVAAGIVLFPNLLGFPSGTGTVEISWGWSLGFALDHNFQWGTDYLFTYGPLGFLTAPFNYGSRGLWLISAPFTLLCMALTLLVLVRACLMSGERVWSAAWVGELIVCVLLIKACAFAPETTLFLTAYALLGLSLFQGTSRTRIIILVAGILAVSAQIKATMLAGAVVLIGTNLAASFLLRDRKRIKHGTVLAVMFPLLWLLLWVGCGQALTGLPTYIRGIYEIASGYGKAMAVTGYTYQVILALLSLAFYLMAWWRSGRHNREQQALLLITAPVLFLFWKEGFVRQDQPFWGIHSLHFFGAMVYIFWLHYLMAKMRAPLARDLFLTGALVTMSFVWLCVPERLPAWDPYTAGSYVQEGFQAVFTDEHENVEEQLRGRLHKSFDLAPVLTAALQPVPTLVLPWDTIMAPAYNVPLAQPPVPQLYSVYTSYLDHLQTSWLDESQPPQAVYAQEAMDSRYPLFEAPEFNYHLLRQYAVVARAGAYAVLQRNEAGIPRIQWQGFSQPGHLRQKIDLPAVGPGQDLLIKVGIKRSWAGEIYGFFYKTATPKILFVLKNGTVRVYSFVYSTGEDGLLVSHHVDNMQEYERLNKMEFPPNVEGVVFGVTPSQAWQYDETFPVEFGVSTVSEAVLRPVSPSMQVDASWRLEKDDQGERLSNPGQPRSIPVLASQSIGNVDSVTLDASKGEIQLRGWAGSISTGMACTAVLLVDGSQVLKVIPLDQPRPDVATTYKRAGLGRCGFSFTCPVPLVLDPSRPLRLLGYMPGDSRADDRLVELGYGGGASPLSFTLENGTRVALTPAGLVFGKK